MRPLRLELKGFSTFRDQTVIDFSDVDLVAFVGPTGAGKSSIIDGIIFALFGSVVRYKSSNLVAPIINQLSAEARVRLDFAVGDHTYTAVRIVRRTAKGATTKEARLESGDVVLAGNARELDEAVEELLGLSFDQFTKTVVLPQGDFARFLTEAPEARQSLLRRLLGMELYRSMGSTARERAKTAETKRAALIEQGNDRPEVTDEVVAAAAAELASLSALQGAIVAEVDATRGAERDVAEARARETEAAQHLDLVKSLKIPAAAKKMEKEFGELDEKRVAARDRAEEAAGELADANQHVEELPTAVELERLLELHADADGIDARIAVARAAVTDVASALERTVEAERVAKDELDSIEERRNSVRVKAGAAGLRSALQVGEPCPVCDQVVHEEPTHDVSAELSVLDDEFDAHRRALDRAQTARRDAEQNHARCEAEVRALEERRGELTEALDGEPDLSTITKQLRATRTAESRLAKAQSKAERALAALNDIEARFLELTTEASSLRRELTTARDALAVLDPPSPSEESIIDDWSALVDWAAGVTTDVRATKKQATADAKGAEKRAVEHQSRIAELCAPHTDGTVPSDPVAWLSSELGRTQARLELLEREQAAQDKARDRIEALHTESTVAGELGRLLNARGFEQWLMTDVMHALADRATDRLLELSGGAYSMLTDGTEFSIRDHRNADEVRGARTLSGGETFLASLSLALALTDNIASLATDGAPAIESMFLDEGFGTLDTETLDVVASAIEELGAEGRMIGIVTHIRDLADRIPVRFDVARTPNGSTVVRTTLD